MTSPPPSGQEDAPLEAALARLEEIARTLEKGDLALEQSLALFEEGVGLARRLETRLADAEMKIETLVRSAAGDRTVPFEPESE